MITELKKHHVIEQLRKHGYTDIEGKNYDELVKQLVVIRALEVNVESSENKWF